MWRRFRAGLGYGEDIRQKNHEKQLGYPTAPRVIGIDRNIHKKGIPPSDSGKRFGRKPMVLEKNKSKK
ncbi:MAG: hypothetical protein HS132_19240 [Planctomycetia bacterium]|nr:hypothetical protein [Planctomycetia bacterium]